MSEQTIKISVVITCYNYGKYLELCLNSVLAQTYTNYEIIVVDDGSTDNTPEVIESFKHLQNFFYIRQKNSGQANAKNVGINNSSCEFVAFLDADDLWDISKLEKQIALFKNKSVGVVYSTASYIDENGNILQHINSTEKYLFPKSGSVTEFLIFDNFIPFSSAIIRKKCLECVGAFDESLTMGIDWDLWLRISTKYEFDFVDEPLLRYRVGHPGQMSKKLEERQRCSDCILNNFLQNNQGLISEEKIKKTYFYTYCNRGYYYRKIDWARSNRFYLKAIKIKPAETGGYRGLIKNILFRYFRIFTMSQG